MQERLINSFTDIELKNVIDKLFMDEAKAYGLTKEEIEECRKAGLTPEEWVEDNNKK